MFPSKKRAQVLQLAYACSPLKGSEPGVGWHRAVEAAKYSDVWVITEGNEFKHQVLGHLDEIGDIDGLHFVFVAKTPFEAFLSRVPGGYYLAYNLWHRRAFHVAQQLHEDVHFDLVHQVNMCGFREPGYLWKLGVPFVWGPIGGTQNFPTQLLAEANWREAANETLRTMLNRLQLHFGRRVHQAARRADVMLAANTSIKEQFERAVGRRTDVLCEIGTTEVVQRQSSNRSDDRLRLLWAGECRSRKGLSLLLKAMAELPDDVQVELRVLGDGPSLTRWQQMAEQLGVADRIEWLGWLPHCDALEQYSWADLFMFTSLRDTTGTVLLEAISNGVPVLAWNHQGVKDLVTAESGIKVEVTNPTQMISDFRDAIVRLARDSELRHRLSVGASARAEHYLWVKQGERMRDYYRSALPPGYLWDAREESPSAGAADVAASVPEEVLS